MSLIAVEAAIKIADPSTRQALIEKSAPIQKATRDDERGAWSTALRLTRARTT